jgi:hypothetical protein
MLVVSEKMPGIMPVSADKDKFGLGVKGDPRRFPEVFRMRQQLAGAVVIQLRFPKLRSKCSGCKLRVVWISSVIRLGIGNSAFTSGCVQT